MMNTFTGTVSEGRVDTPLGSVLTDINDGVRAQVLVRPEGVIIENNSNDSGASVEITSSHLLGHDNIVRARLNNGIGGELYVRVHHTFEVELKKNLSARLDPEYAFVFPLEDKMDLENLKPLN
jgi:hypothetical protein